MGMELFNLPPCPKNERMKKTRPIVCLEGVLINPIKRKHPVYKVLKQLIQA